jgi:hypothetical protein
VAEVGAPHCDATGSAVRLAAIRAVFLRLERDRELRERIMRACGRSGMVAISASTARDKDLDELAELVSLRRRIVEDVA